VTKMSTPRQAPTQLTDEELDVASGGSIIGDRQTSFASDGGLGTTRLTGGQEGEPKTEAKTKP